MIAARNEIPPSVRSLLVRKARQLAGMRCFADREAEDIEQELFAAVVRARLHHSLSAEQAANYLRRVIHNKVASMIRAQTRQKRDLNRETGSLNKQVPDESGGSVAQWATLPQEARNGHTMRAVISEQDQLQLRADIAAALADASAQDRKVAALLGRYTKHAAGKRLGISRRQFEKSVQRLRQRFEDAGLRAYLPEGGQLSAARRK